KLLKSQGKGCHIGRASGPKAARHPPRAGPQRRIGGSARVTSYSNYDDVVDQLTRFGLLLERGGIVVGTSKAQRCRVEGGGREKRGWYWLHEIPANQGGTLIVGSYGIWQGNESNTQKVELRKGSQLSGEQAAALRKRLAD